MANRCKHSSMRGSEAGSYLRLIDFVYHLILDVRVMKKKTQIHLHVGRGIPFGRGAPETKGYEPLERTASMVVLCSYITSFMRNSAPLDPTVGLCLGLGWS